MSIPAGARGKDLEHAGYIPELARTLGAILAERYPSGYGAPKRIPTRSDVVSTKTVLWVVVGLLVVLVGWLALRPSGGVENVDAAGVREAIEAGAQVIDVRTAAEYQLGHIPGARNVPVDTVAQEAPAWDRNATYVVYCATGSRSAAAVTTMESLGFGQIKHFSAGMQAWDGEVQQGAATGGTSGAIPTDGRPVMAEFSTNS
jgi:phage shock protein E